MNEQTLFITLLILEIFIKKSHKVL